MGVECLAREWHRIYTHLIYLPRMKKMDYLVPHIVNMHLFDEASRVEVPFRPGIFLWGWQIANDFTP